MTKMVDVPVICGRCGADHDIIACPFVKAVEFDDAMRVSRIEFLTPADYAQPRVVKAPDDAPPAAGPSNYAKLGQKQES